MSITKIKKEIGISYLGGCNSPKLKKSIERNVLTYGVYLAPYNLSGHNVCPESHQCRDNCLNGAGRNKIELLTHKEGGRIQKARIKKTKLFFENRDKFMQILCAEIDQSRKKASKAGMQFAVRLNCTSDLSPEQFTINDKNILEMYPDIQFYDYTKVLNRIALTKKYPNYDLTYSYSGTNWSQCETLLQQGYRVAVVFEKDLPAIFNGYPVINANNNDTRYLDEGGVICGLTYKRVANDYVNGKYKKPDTKFITKSDDTKCNWNKLKRTA